MAMTPWQLDTPVVMMVFNRPDCTSLVFEAVRAARPRQLLVIADGPRDRAGEAELCAQVRQVFDAVDWECEVRTEFSEENLGCRRRVSSGLDWVFSQVEEAIILEDDCLPHPSFFPFCRELLARYRNEPRIGQIAGVNFQFGRHRIAESYYYSRFNHIWGWATWRRAWLQNDKEMAHWPAFRDAGALNGILSGRKQAAYWSDVLDRVASGEIDTWDCQWTLSCWRHGLLSVIPAVNLVSNIGFGPGATHTPVPNKYADMPVQAVRFPLVHPAVIAPDAVADAYTLKTQYREYPFLARLLAAVKARLRKLAGRE
ncbi:glycosyltransferase family 2 protein [Geomonas paludis]|uniref:Glycosyltransferase family 2 protein n=1 Tax=Geomonas paludis TaxID=2740185 RepID=A0A6V8MXV3_9BACT|nr:glycosyltransferase family 2 protein [Geomonas paludis]UPU34368.1 glycosyltransferase family 2 protein [Geomonas paludis]GFO64353.1 hemolytic protein HlpA [Geomonas paludis]